MPTSLSVSTGLNVLSGARSTGKTHTLDAISMPGESVKYIRLGVRTVIAYGHA
jgi:DNA repair ATPase RecN